MTELTVELPTYNEAENLPILVDRLESLGIDLEIVVIDDNSPDGTAQVVKSLSEKYGNIKLVQRPKKLGLASAIFDGLSVASGEYIAVMDADLQHPPETLVKMLEETKKGNDIIIASRYVRSGGMERFGIGRRIISRGATFLAHAMLRETRPIKDPMSGFFIFRKDVLDGKKIESDGYKILLEVLVKGRCENRRIAEIPYTFRPRTRGKSKLSFHEDIKFVRLLLLLSQFRPVKFLSVGASGVLVNMSLLFLLNTFTASSLALAGAVAIETSIISNFILNHIWTFRDRSVGNSFLGFLKYNLVAAPGGIINLAILLKLSMFTHYLLANLVGIAFAFVVNYLGSELIVWKRALRREPTRSGRVGGKMDGKDSMQTHGSKSDLRSDREISGTGKTGKR